MNTSKIMKITIRFKKIEYNYKPNTYYSWYVLMFSKVQCRFLFIINDIFILSIVETLLGSISQIEGNKNI